MARAILILALLVATTAAARDLMQVEPAAGAPAPVEPNTSVAVTTPESTTTAAPEATMAVTTPEATVPVITPEAQATQTAVLPNASSMVPPPEVPDTIHDCCARCEFCCDLYRKWQPCDIKETLSAQLQRACLHSGVTGRLFNLQAAIAKLHMSASWLMSHRENN
jgi:hypothetical protein